MGRWFGRDKEEDPLAGLRGDGESSISSVGSVSGSETSGLPSSKPEGDGGGGVGAAFVFAVLVVAAYIAMIIYLENQSPTEKTETSTAAQTQPTTTTPATTEAAAASTAATIQTEATTVEPKKPASLLSSSGVNQLFSVIKKNVGSSDEVSLRIQADRADVTAGKRQLTIGPDLEVASADASGVGFDEVKLSDLSASGLNRAITTVIKRQGVGRDRIDYILLFGSQWSIFLNDKFHTLWRASLDGQDVTKSGGSQ